MEEKRRKFNTVDEAIEFIEGENYMMSFTQLKYFKESPRHLIRYLMGEESVGDAARFSKRFHVLLFEGEEVFFDKYIINEKGVVMNSFNERLFVRKMVNDVEGDDFVLGYQHSYTVKGKGKNVIEREAKEKWGKFGEYIGLVRRANKEGKGIVGKKDYVEMLKLVDVAKRDGKMWDMIKGCDKREFEMFKNFEVDNGEGGKFGVKFKGRLDGWKSVGRNKYIGDLKVLASAETRKAMRVVTSPMDWLYVQAYIYSEMAGLKDDEKFYFWVLDRGGNSNIFEVSYELRMMGKLEVEKYLKWFRFCKMLRAWDRSYGFYSVENIGGEDGVWKVFPTWTMEG